MSFKFSAKAVLELGKELISSDEVAIFELIKNSIDAGSPLIEVIVEIQLLYTDYMYAVEMLEEGATHEDTINILESRLVDPDNNKSTLLLDDLKQAQSGPHFLNRLNRFYEEANFFEIRDTGHGMSIGDLTDIFLRIGTSMRHKENLVGAKNLGDKGIGRLSAMRLGDRLQVNTTPNGDRHWNLLDIDWSLFSNEDDVDADSIVIEPKVGDQKEDTAVHGTTIRISALTADWDYVKFVEIFEGRIARMIDPFVPGLANQLIVARHNGTRVLIPCIPQELLKAAHAECHVEFRMVGEVPTINGYVDYKLRHRKQKIDVQGAEVFSLTQESFKRRAKRGHAAYKLIALRPSAFKELGNFKSEIYWYNRRVIKAIEGLTNKPTEARREVMNWNGGPMLYRYGYRIVPYGDPKDDWLALDEAAFGSQGFKLNRQQVIGRVSLETPHSVLSEQTNREGLIASEAFTALQKIMSWVVHDRIRGLINEADELERSARRKAEQDSGIVEKARTRVESALERLRESVGKESGKRIDELSKSVESLSNHSKNLVERIQAVIEEADDEREKFVYLAGIGLMTEFIFHELERAVSYTMAIIDRRTTNQTTIDLLLEQLKTLHKRIAAFDELTGEKRQRKSKFDLVELVRDILENHSREFDRHGIKVTFEHQSKSFVISAVRGMVIQILENLIANSAYWLKKQKIYELELYAPSLTVTIDGDLKILTFEDNGPGVIEDERERIFQPFITNKPTGQGRGLGLYISRELAENYGWKLCMDDEIGQIRAGRTNKFLLSME